LRKGCQTFYLTAGVLILALSAFLKPDTAFCAGGRSEDKNYHTLKNRSFQTGCTDCHASDPRETPKGTDIPDEAKYRALCSDCHAIPESCRLICTEKATEILKSQLHYLGIPVFSGTISCRSCHFFHERESVTAHEHKLNNFYPNFWFRIQQSNPHRSGVFCQLCHETSLNLSVDNLKLKFQGDKVAVCTQCHNGKKARADNHPVRVEPSKDKGVRVPEEFPLSNGKVTCLTCHKMPCQGGAAEGNLLRGGPYEKRVDACLVCHSKERYQAVNPHIQIDEKGKIMKDKCLYCHII
jgi:hypothetical protein